MNNIQFQDLEDIPGIGSITAERLREIGIFTPKQLSLYGIDELSSLLDLTDYTRINRALMNVRKVFRPQRIVTAAEYSSTRLRFPRITTGVESIDQLLLGGVEPRCIYEVVGEYGTGKSHFCFQLSTTVQLTTNRKGVCGKVFYIDSEGTFSDKRVQKMAERFNIEDALENIFISQPMNVDEQIDCIRSNVPKHIEYDAVKLVILDGLVSHIRAEYRGREMLVARQQTLNYMLNFLLRIAMLYNVYVVITNQVVAKPVLRGGLTAAGGHVVAHGTTHRLFFTRYTASSVKKSLRSSIRRIIIEDSPYLQKGDAAIFAISEDGLVDVQ